jgi:3-oxoacyl-[acyl-carrier protein] reductase
MKKIAITGATGNIGAGLVTHFQSKGFEVFPITRDLINLESESPFTNFFQKNPDFSVDYWVNNAAVQDVSLLKDMSFEELQKQFAVNTFALFNFYHEVANRKVVTESILNISSVEAINARPGHSHYGASKAAVDSLTRSAAVELAPIRSNSLSLGLIHRDGIEDAWPQGVNAWNEATPLKHMGRLEEISHAVEFLLTATWITGEHLTVDGGNTIATNW